LPTKWKQISKLLSRKHEQTRTKIILIFLKTQMKPENHETCHREQTGLCCEFRAHGKPGICRSVCITTGNPSMCANRSSCIFYRAHVDVNVRRVFPGTHDKQLIHHVPPLDTRWTTPSPCDDVTTHGDKGHVRSALAVTLHRVSNEDTRRLYLFVVC
jgi:hypothetical protein